jgi:CRP-like cAMP-binding protein
VGPAVHLVLFRSLPENDLHLLIKKLKPKSFKKGAPLVEVGAVQRELYFIKSGIQMAYFNSLEKDYVMAFTQCPDLCAIPDSFSFQTPSHFRLVAITPALERLFRRMTEKILAGIITRHVELHSLTMEERFKAFCKRSPHLLKEVPHKYLASYLGIDPTNFSKLFNSVRI